MRSFFAQFEVQWKRSHYVLLHRNTEENLGHTICHIKKKVKTLTRFQGQQPDMRSTEKTHKCLKTIWIQNHRQFTTDVKKEEISFQPRWQPAHSLKTHSRQDPPTLPARRRPPLPCIDPMLQQAPMNYDRCVCRQARPPATAAATAVATDASTPPPLSHLNTPPYPTGRQRPQ